MVRRVTFTCSARTLQLFGVYFYVEAFGWQGREDCVDLYILPLSLSLNMPIAEKPLLNSRISLDLPQGVDPTKTIPAFGDRAIPRVVSEPSPPLCR